MEDTGTIRLTIDGQEIEVPEGTTILEAAKKLSINIPTFCYHEALTPYGACRLCCVEVTQGTRTSIKASCLLKAREGDVVTTDTPRLARGRKIMAELLVANIARIQMAGGGEGPVALDRSCVEEGLVHVRAILGNVGCLVLPDQVVVPNAYEAFREDGGLVDEKRHAKVEELGRTLARTLSRLLAGP